MSGNNYSYGCMACWPDAGYYRLFGITFSKSSLTDNFLRKYAGRYAAEIAPKVNRTFFAMYALCESKLPHGLKPSIERGKR